MAEEKRMTIAEMRHHIAKGVSCLTHEEQRKFALRVGAVLGGRYFSQQKTGCMLELGKLTPFDTRRVYTVLQNMQAMPT